MKHLLLVLFGLLSFHFCIGQVTIHPDSLLAEESVGATLCYNNSSLMVGNNINDRYTIYFTSDTIFLNVKQGNSRTKKTAYVGNNIVLATATLYMDTIWICWKEQAFIKACYSANKGDTWSTVFNVSTAGVVSAPSIYAASNGKIHFVWHNESSTDTTVSHTVYYNGTFLQTPNTLSTPTQKGSWPSVAAIGDTVLCVWKERNNNVSKVYFSKSFNGGQSGSWSVSSLTNGPNTSKDPNVSYAFDAETNTYYVYIVYDGANKVYLQRTTDFGANWSSPTTLSNFNKKSQFAKVECNNSGFVGVCWAHFEGANLFDDTQKDVGFVYSENWGNDGSFSSDSLVYLNSPFGSVLASLNKIDESHFYLVWLSNDTTTNQHNIYERQVEVGNGSTGVNTYEEKPLIHLYPNPTSEYLIFENKSAMHTSTTLIIYNSFGKELLKREVNTTFDKIDVSGFSKGVYFIKTTNSASSVHKINIY